MSLDYVPVSSVMTRDVSTIGENDSLQQTCKVMQIKDIGNVIVVSSDNEPEKVPVGIVTERDIVKHMAIDPSHGQFSARELMSHPLITVTSDTSMKVALRLIVSRNIHRLPVVGSGKLTGIVIDKDISRAIAKNEFLISAIFGDELLIRHVEELEQPWIYNLGEFSKRGLATALANPET